MTGFIKMLLSLSLSGSVLGLAVLLLSRLGKKQLRSGFIYLCWALVLLRFVLPLNGLFGPNLERYVPERASIPYEASGQVRSSGYYSSPLSRTEGTLTWDAASKNAQKALNSSEFAQVQTLSEETSAPGERNALQSAAAAARELWNNGKIWFYLWLAGALVSITGTICSFLRFRRVLFRTLKPALPLDSSVLSALNASPYPALYRSDKVSTTMLLGLVRPVIILPDREYSSEMLDRMLRHELTHYRRGDLALKWLQMLVVSVHWFNPLVYLFRTQAALYCELSCDQKLIKSMNRDDKQSYGEMLLNLAADKALPRRVIAVSFTTQKRDLKERLVQIMTFKKLGKQALALMLAALIMVCSLAYVLGPAQASTQTPGNDGSGVVVTDEDRLVYHVSTVDDLLHSLGDNRTIYLAPGTYDLTKAQGYGWGQTAEYYWEEVADGYQLVIDVVCGLTIAGEGPADEVNIVTSPRSAAVLKFNGCANPELRNVTVGHTLMPDACQGAVLYFYGCRNTLIDNCVLYGCGTIGVQAYECWKFSCTNTVIKECSVGAVEMSYCYEAAFDGCEFRNCSAHDGYPGYVLIQLYNNSDLGFYNCSIHDNYTMSFVESSNTHGLEMIGCRVKDNRFDTGFSTWGDAITLAQNEFGTNALSPTRWFDGQNSFALGPDGSQIDGRNIENMQWSEYHYAGRTVEETEKPEGKQLENGMMEYHVNNIDDLLACLGSDTVICLESGLYEISSAKQYGGKGGINYYWSECYDGYGLVLMGIKNLKIVGPEEKAHIELYPRSADVMAFRFCDNVRLENLVLGHTQGAGGCTGDVVSFMGCGFCDVVNCELFGCGVNGVNAYACTDIRVTGSMIYECSGYAAVISDCADTVFENVIIRDCTNNSILTQRCRVSFSGETYYSDNYVPKDYYDDGYYSDDYGDEYGYEFDIEYASAEEEDEAFRVVPYTEPAQYSDV